MSDEIDGGNEAESAGDVLREFGAEEEAEPKAEAKEPEPKKAPEKKPEAKEPEKAEPKKDEKPPPEKKRYKVKVRDEEAEVDEDELVRGYQRARDVTKKAQELAEQRKQVEHARSLAKTDPAKALELLGLTPDEYAQHAEKHVYSRFQREFDANGQPLSPEQKHMRELEAKLAERDAKDKAEADRVKGEEEQKTRAEAERHWVKTIVTHLEKSGDPKHLLPRIARHLSDAIEADQALDPADVLDDATALAWEDIAAEHSKLYDSLDGEALAKALGPATIEKVRKHIVAEFKKKRGAAKPVEIEIAPEVKERREREAKPRTSRDVLRAFVG